MLRRLLLMMMCVSTVAFAKTPIDTARTNAIDCMTKVIAMEAPDESDLGKLAIAQVVINRMQTKGFPKSVCEVIYQRSSKGCQFTWVCQKPRHISAELARIARKIALEALDEGKRVKSLGNALYYHTLDCEPHWDHIRQVQTIGNHVFFASTAGK